MSHSKRKVYPDQSKSFTRRVGSWIFTYSHFPTGGLLEYRASYGGDSFVCLRGLEGPEEAQRLVNRYETWPKQGYNWSWVSELTRLRNGY